MKLPSASGGAARGDELGLRRALSGLMLPALVAAMAFLAALALAGWEGSTALAYSWRNGAHAALTVQVPRPNEAVPNGGNRLGVAVALLSVAPGVASVHPLTDAEVAKLLRPWIGGDGGPVTIPLPGVIAVRLTGDDADTEALHGQLAEAVPGIAMEDHGQWVRRLADLAWSLQACSLLAVALVSAVAVAVIAVATRSGLMARREAIEILHGLGASDGFIASRFARRATVLALAGGLAGMVLAVPVLAILAGLVAPFTGSAVPEVATLESTIAAVPVALWADIAALPMSAALIGFLTAQGTVRRWLRRLP